METDLDLGRYERFIDESLTREREGGYYGSTVQIIPHVSNEIKEEL